MHSPKPLWFLGLDRTTKIFGAGIVGLEAVRIVLVEPAGARNLGSVARVMKNFGLTTLVLVNPQCDHLCDEAMHMAVHAKELLETAIVVPDLPSALVGCHRVAATVGREEMQAESLRSVTPWLLPDFAKTSQNPQTWGLGTEDLTQIQSAIVFGREDHGLSNAELKYAQRCITIPSNPDYPSLNLAQAVGICCYELSQQALSLQGSEVQLEPSNRFDLQSSTGDAAPFQLTNAFYLGLEELLLTIGYLHDHTAESRMTKFRLLLDRAVPTSHEMTMLLGILRQAKWAIAQDPQNLLVKGKPTEIPAETE
jgi:tRNA/rRNA methyltransferase